jgi:hypothetical protein
VKSSSASDSRSDHALLNALHTLQVLESILVQHIHVQLFHDLNHDVERLEEAVHSNAQHAVCRGLVLRPQDCLLLVTSSVFASGIDQGERATDERRELFVNGKRIESCFG